MRRTNTVDTFQWDDFKGKIVVATTREEIEVRFTKPEFEEYPEETFFWLFSLDEAEKFALLLIDRIKQVDAENAHVSE